MDFASVNLNELGTKAQSKGELYRLLTVEGGLYLPPQEQTSLDFISDICFKERQAFKASEVTVCSVPHIKGLRSENLIEFIVENCNAEGYLPANYKKYTPNRTFLGNLCNTLDPEGFKTMMTTVLKTRETKILMKKNLKIDIDSEIARVFESSQMVAVHKGKSHKLLRKNLIRKEKEEEKLQQKELEEAAKNAEKLRMEVFKLEEVIEEKERHIDDLCADSNILKRLFKEGVIDENGNATHI